MPNDKSVPILMICGGTGLAPFRSFWLDRQKDLQNEKSKTNFGDMVLFFGCRDSKNDYLYKQELSNLILNKVIKSVHTAFSRDKNHPKVRFIFVLKSHCLLIRSFLI